MAILDAQQYAYQVSRISSELDATNGKLVEFGVALQGKDSARAGRILTAMVSETESTNASLKRLQPPSKGEDAHQELLAYISTRLKGLAVMQAAVRAEIEYPNQNHEELLKSGLERYSRSEGRFASAASLASDGKTHGTPSSPQSFAPSTVPSVETNHNGLVVVSLALFFPLGLFLMWKYATWRSETKWYVASLFCWPLWARMLDRSRSQSVVWSVGALLAVAEIGLVARLTSVALLIGIVAAIASFAHLTSPRCESAQSDLIARGMAEGKLARSDCLVADAELSGQLELLPRTSPIQQQYVEALNIRDAGAKCLQAAKSTSDVTTADEQLAASVSKLLVVRQALMADLPSPASVNS